jgi:hypothetical protein
LENIHTYSPIQDTTEILRNQKRIHGYFRNKVSTTKVIQHRGHVNLGQETVLSLLKGTTTVILWAFGATEQNLKYSRFCVRDSNQVPTVYDSRALCVNTEHYADMFQTRSSRRERHTHTTGTQTAEVSSAPSPLGYVTCTAVSGGRASHVPTHGHVSASPSSSLTCSDGRLWSGVTFKSNLRALYLSAPPPPHLLFRRQLTKFHLSLIVVYKTLQNVRGTFQTQQPVCARTCHVRRYRKRK